MPYTLIAKAASAASPDRRKGRLGEAVAPDYTVGEVCGPALHRARSAIRWAVSRAFALVMCSYATASSPSAFRCARPNMYINSQNN